MVDDGATTVTGLIQPTPSTEHLSAQLHVVYPPELAAQIPLGAAAVTLGRASREGVHPVRHATISRRHAQIVWFAGAHQVRDLGSRNGCRLDGVPLTEGRPLQPGAVLRMGDTLAVYDVGTVGEDGEAVDPAALPGRSGTVRALRRLLARAAPDPDPVLLIGETGTGKEYLAREVHRLSGRAGPFVAVNCAALSAQLISSQLFGHVRGAFTGATTSAQGLFRDAQGGTLLLDEIGDLPLDLQPKLLRVLQEREVLPVGATRPIAIDVRVVGATLHPLARRVEQGLFRRDLYARLAAWELHIPALRARRCDLLDWFARLHRDWRARRPRLADPPLTLDADAAERLLLDPWPENLRGLGRVMHRLAALGRAAPIDGRAIEALLGERARVEVLPAAAPPVEAPVSKAARPKKPTAEELSAAFERLGSVRAVARHYQRDRKQIYRWLDAFGLPRPG